MAKHKKIKHNGRIEQTDTIFKVCNYFFLSPNYTQMKEGNHHFYYEYKAIIQK